MNQQNPPTPFVHGPVVVVVLVVVVVVVGASWQEWLFPQLPEQQSELDEHGLVLPVGMQASVVLVVVDVPITVVVVAAGFVVVVAAGLVVVVVVGGRTCAGAHRSWSALGCTVREPNWSVTTTAGGAPFGHFTL
jgi:hypothetical protein